MENAKSIWEVASLLDGARTELNDVIAGINILDDAIEGEGFQTEKNFKEWRAIQFSRRFPLYLSAFRSVVGNLKRISEAIEAGANMLYEMEKQRKEGAQ